MTRQHGTDTNARNARKLRRRFIVTLIAVAVVLATLAAFTFAWFTGFAVNSDNRISTGETTLQLLTTSPTLTIEAGSETHTAAPTFIKAGTAQSILYNLSDSGERTVVSLDDNPHALAKFLETSDGAQGIDDAFPDFRQQRPIIVYNASDVLTSYTLEFLTHEAGAQISDVFASLDTAYYFNYTPLVVDGYDSLADAAYRAAFPSRYDIPEGVLSGKLPGVSATRVGGNDYDASTIKLIADRTADGEVNTILNMAREIRRINRSLRTQNSADEDTAVQIAPHACHIYMVDMGITHTAGNTYQRADLSIDILLQQGSRGGDTIHYVNSEESLRDAVKAICEPGRAGRKGNSGDTILLTADVTVTGDISPWNGNGTVAGGANNLNEGIFNLVLSGHTLTLEGDGAALMLRFPDVDKAGVTLQTMDIGSPEGGRIVGADKLQITGNSTPNSCVVNWYWDIAFHADGSTPIANPADEADGASAIVSYRTGTSPEEGVAIPGTGFAVGKTIVVAGTDAHSLPVPVTTVVRTGLQQRAARYTDYHDCSVAASYGRVQSVIPDGSPERPFVVNSRETFVKMIYDLTGVAPSGAGFLPARTDFSAVPAGSLNFLLTENVADIKNLPKSLHSFAAPAVQGGAATEVNLIFAPGKRLVGLDTQGEAEDGLLFGTSPVHLQKIDSLAVSGGRLTSVPVNLTADSDRLEDYLADVSYGVGEGRLPEPYVLP